MISFLRSFSIVLNLQSFISRILRGALGAARDEESGYRSAVAGRRGRTDPFPERALLAASPEADQAEQQSRIIKHFILA